MTGERTPAKCHVNGAFMVHSSTLGEKACRVGSIEPQPWEFV
jgi:hypothetical protein